MRGNLGIFLKRIDPLNLFSNKLNMKNIGTKSTNMSYIIVYLAMFSATIDIILYPKMKMSHYFSLMDPVWNFDDPRYPPIWNSQIFSHFLVWKASLTIVY